MLDDPRRWRRPRCSWEPSWLRRQRKWRNKAPCPHGLGAAGEGALAYYADSVEGRGQCLGRGLSGFSAAGEVARSELEAMLSGRHPGTYWLLLEHGEAELCKTYSGLDEDLYITADAEAFVTQAPGAGLTSSAHPRRWHGPW